MFSRTNHPFRKHPQHLLFFFFPVMIALVPLACEKTEHTDVGDNSKIVMPVRKPIPTPPDPMPSEKTDSENGKMHEVLGPEHKEEHEHQGLTAEAHTRDGVPGQHSPEIQSGPTMGQGQYRVRKGDSLSGIAEKPDIYGNPLKWTSLFRLNMEKFEDMKITRDFQHQELPEGLHLKYVTPSEAKANIRKWGKRVYAVNVLSEETTKRITPHAITLIRNGYNAYICTAVVKNKEWIRLRAGFFRNRTAADEAGNRIASLLDGTKVWVVKISPVEINDYCGDG